MDSRAYILITFLFCSFLIASCNDSSWSLSDPWNLNYNHQIINFEKTYSSIVVNKASKTGFFQNKNSTLR